MSVSYRKAKISEREWERHKKDILNLYLGRDLTLRQLAEEMKGRLDASVSQLEAQLKVWNARKNLKPHEWEHIFNTIEKLPPGTQSQVIVCGYKISDRRIHRARRARKRQTRLRRQPDGNVEGNNRPNIQQLEDVSIEILEPDAFPTVHGIIPAQQRALPTEEGNANNYFDSMTSSHSNTHDRERDVLLAVQQNANSPIQLNVDIQQPCNSVLPVSWPTGEPASHNIWAIANAPFIRAMSRAWLQSLPSRLFEDRIYSNLSLNLVGPFRPDNMCGYGALIPSPWMQLFRDTMQSEGAPRTPLPFPVSLVHTLDTFLQGSNDDQHTMITSSDNIDELWLIRIISRSIINGFSGLDGIPLDRIVKFLGHFQSLSIKLIQALAINRSRATQSLAENLFRAAIDANETQIVDQLLETGLIKLNEISYESGIGKETAIERASRLRNLEMIKIMIRHGADVNSTLKVPCSGALDTFLFTITSESGITTDWLDIVRVLLEAGAKVRPHIFFRPTRTELDKDLTSLLLRNLQPSDHPGVIRTLLVYVATLFEDDRAAEEVYHMIRMCKEFHNRKCFFKFPREILKASIVGARGGKCALVKLLLPYLQRSFGLHPVHCYQRLLGAAIMSRRDDLIDLILQEIPQPQPQFYVLRKKNVFGGALKSRVSKSPARGVADAHDFNTSAPTPLEAAIITKNIPLIQRFEHAGALAYFDNHPNAQESVAAIIHAACKVGDVAYARKLLPILHSASHSAPKSLTGALVYAMNSGEESFVLELLDTGVLVSASTSIYRTHVNESSIMCTPLQVAIAQRNDRYVRAVLSADIKEDLDQTWLGEAIKWGDKSIILDLLTTFPELTGNFCHLRVRKGYDLNIASTANSNMLDFILESTATTRVMLNACLQSAIRNHSDEIIRKLLDRGADPSAGLDRAVDEYTDGLGILLFQIAEGIKPAINDSGMPALIAAIEGGPESIKILDALLRSELFDLKKEVFLFHRSPPGTMPATAFISPLGLAMRTEKNHDPDLLIINRLLAAGCPVNSIAWRDRTDASYGYIISRNTLLMAITTKNEHLVRLLIDHGANIHSQAVLTVKQTPLQCAAETGSIGIVKLLLERGADVNAEPAARTGGTALQFAAVSGICAVAIELLAHGANLHAPPSKVNGRWPLEAAAENGRLDMIEFLWRANKETITLELSATGFEPVRCFSAMRLAEENGHLACKGLIADLSGYSVRAAEVPSDNHFGEFDETGASDTEYYNSSDSYSSDSDG